MTEEELHIAKIVALIVVRHGGDAAGAMLARAENLRRAGQPEDARLWQRVAEACAACLRAEQRR